MIKHSKILLLLAVLALGLLAAAPAAAQAAPQLRAVLFYSPSCPHCHYVIDEVLPVLHEQYGDQLTILLVDITTEGGNQLYRDTITAWELPTSRQGVPTLLAGDRHLVGSLEIEQDFPRILSSYRATGLDWPAVPGLEPYIEEAGFDRDLAGIVDPNQQPPGWLDRFQRDPVGNGLSVLVLLGLAAGGLWNLRRLSAPEREPQPWPARDLALLLAAGIFVAGYLSWVELTLNPALCGPVGDCNAVQQSDYARLFGLLPVGLLGLGGYLSIGGLWLAATRAGDSNKIKWEQAAWALALVGLLFSLYLTFLEPFVIGATCAWCLASAIIMGLVFWQATTRWLAARQGQLRQRRAQKRKGYSQ